MRLEKYISDLLYRYDLVIIPEFGGIIGRRNPAKIEHTTHTFSPPYKNLSFNINLKNSDGLLVDYVAGIKEISHQKALDYILLNVADWKRELQETKRLKLDNLGFFNLLDHERILFSPFNTTNYLREAYGLHTFIYSSVEKEKNIVKKVVTAEKPLKTAKNISHQQKEIKYSFRRNLMKYAAIFLVGAGLFTGVAYLYPKMQQQNAARETYQKATFILNDSFPAIRIDYKTKEVKTISYPYHIIAGAFRIEANAIKKIGQLKQAGFDAEIIGKNKYNLYMVSYQGYPSKTEAKQALRLIKKRQKSAWVYKQI